MRIHIESGRPDVEATEPGLDTYGVDPDDGGGALTQDFEFHASHAEPMTGGVGT